MKQGVEEHREYNRANYAFHRRVLLSSSPEELLRMVGYKVKRKRGVTVDGS